jgi:hypothetical protein
MRVVHASSRSTLIWLGRELGRLTGHLLALSSGWSGSATETRCGMSELIHNAKNESRFEPPPCPKCAARETDVAVSTSSDHYLACSICAHLWRVSRQR